MTFSSVAATFRTIVSGLTIGVFVLAALSTKAVALEPRADEKERLEACEKKICSLAVEKKPTTGNFSCQIGKFWGKKNIKKGAKSKKIGWGFGDARCDVEVRMDHQSLVSALSAPKYELKVWPQIVRCEVETSSGVKPLTVKFAPRLKFKNGRVKKVWLKLKDVNGPDMLSGLIWSTAKLEDSLGIFHSDMVKQINKFLHEKCPKRHAESKAE